MTIIQKLHSRTAPQLTRRTQILRRKFSTNVYQTIKQHPNQGLKVLGAAGALGLGGYVAYSLSRPINYIPSQTREHMSYIGGNTFAKMVRQRIFTTYAYLTGSIALTGITTFFLLSKGIGLRIMQRQMSNPIIFSLATLAGLWVSMGACMSVDYNRSPLLKHSMWAAVNGIMGMTLLSLTAIAGGAIIQQAALITGCIIGGMSTAAMCAPSDYFLSMGPYLGVGLGIVIAASLGGMFFPGSTLLMNVSLYGGLGLFGLYAAHDTQRVLHDAQTRDEFDPISEQMGLYMDTINIFVRVVQILMMQKRK